MDGLQVYVEDGMEASPITSHHDSKASPQIEYSQAQVFSQNTPNRKERILAFLFSPWGLIATTLISLVIGGCIGGGIGTALANSQSRSSIHSDQSPSNNSCASHRNTTSDDNKNSDSNTTNTNNYNLNNYTVLPAENIKSVYLDCPFNFYTEEYTSSAYNVNLNWTCGVNFASENMAAEGGEVADLAVIIAYSLEDCMDACAGMSPTKEKLAGAVECLSVVFSSEIGQRVKDRGGNCWLKNGTMRADASREGGLTTDVYAYKI